MAIMKTGNGNGKYFNKDAKELLINYILRPDKTIHGYFGGVGVDPLCPAESMELVSEQFGKQEGVQLRHFIVSFSPRELSEAATVNEIAQQATMYVGHDYQALYAVHEDRPYLHFHLVQNSVSYLTGARYRGTKQEFYALQRALKSILAQHGIHKLNYVSNQT